MADYRDFPPEKSRDLGTYGGPAPGPDPCGPPGPWTDHPLPVPVTVSPVRRWLIGLSLLVLVAMAGLAVACHSAERGYLAPQFSPDGRHVVVVVRDARAQVLGLGYEMLTPPARVRILRDRLSIVTIDLATGRATTSVTLPRSPLEGTWISTYRPSIFGSVVAHLRWAAPDALEYEVGVTRPAQPSSETFVARRQWDARASRFVETPPWTPGWTGMGGSEPSQLHGNREVVTVRAGTAMPCAVLIVTTGEPKARAVAETPACRKAHPGGYDVTALADVLRRPDIERVARLNATHERLVAEARARGLSEGDAALDAIRGMQRLGLYPKPSTLVATRAAEVTPGAPVFTITATEFQVGLFTDIREALDRPGEEVEKATSPYIIHRDYDTSRQLNELLAARQDSEFFLRADDGLWHVVVDYR